MHRFLSLFFCDVFFNKNVILILCRSHLLQQMLQLETEGSTLEHHNRMNQSSVNVSLRVLRVPLMIS